MIAETLITDDTWAEAPAEPRPAFLFIALAARKRLDHLLNDETELGQKYGSLTWRQQYTSELSAIADTLGISGLPRPENLPRSAEGLAAFDAALARIVTTIRAENRLELRQDSVQLSFTSKEDIRQRLEELRATVNASNLSASLKEKLHQRIDAAEGELDNQRTNLRSFWRLAGSLALASQMSVSTAADMPAAEKNVASIVHALHEHKASEQAQQELMAGLPRLTHQPTKQIKDMRGKAAER